MEHFVWAEVVLSMPPLHLHYLLQGIALLHHVEAYEPPSPTELLDMVSIGRCVEP
jgi:hypothetical protein